VPIGINNDTAYANKKNNITIGKLNMQNKNTISPLFRKNYLALVIPIILSGQVLAAEIEASDTPFSELEVISVTSQKRIQNLQDVPLAVTAISGKAISEAAIQDIFDLEASVPGLIILQSQSGSTTSFSIRGVGTSGQNFGLESSVGTYVDGVYRARQSSIINNLIDVQSVEVLRGPQGTLFGKNTPSGAIQISNVAPDHDGTGFVEGTIGNLGLTSLSFAKSVSAIDDILAFRLTGFASDRDGYISDVNFGKDIMGNKDRYGGRLQALYTPNNDVTVRIIADYAEIDEKCCASGPSVSNFEAMDIKGKFGTDAVISRPPFSANINPPEQFNQRTVAQSLVPISKLEDSGISVQVDWSLNDRLNVISVSANRNFDTYDLFDADATQVNLIDRINDSKQSSFSQEFRLDYSSEKLHAIGGFFYFTQDLDTISITRVNDDLADYVLSAVLGGRLTPMLSSINLLSRVTQGSIAPVAPATAVAEHFSNSVQDHKSWAIFGQFDYKLTDEFTLTAGLRYTNEEKQIANVFTNKYASGNTQPTNISSLGDPSFPETIRPGSLLFSAARAGQALQAIQSGAIAVGTPAFAQAVQTFIPFQQEGWLSNALSAATATRPDIMDDLKEDHITGTIKLAYQPDRLTMIYSSYGTGYKSGGTNTDRIAIGLDPIFDAETSNAFEVGIKKDFPGMGLRVNAAAHYTVTEDFQAAAFIGSNFTLQNAGDYVARGLEIESLWMPTESSKIQLSFAYNDASYDTFDKGPCWSITPWHTNKQDPGQRLLPDGRPTPFCDRAGDKPFGQPKVSGSLGIQQAFALFDSVYSYAFLEYSYLGELMTVASNDPLSQMSGYGRVNARIFFNLEKYDTDIILWGRNITDEQERASLSYPGLLQEGKLFSFFTEPATFGVTVRTRF